MSAAAGRAAAVGRRAPDAALRALPEAVPRAAVGARGGEPDVVPGPLAHRIPRAHHPAGRALVRGLLLPAERVAGFREPVGLPAARRAERVRRAQVPALAVLVGAHADHHRRPEPARD